MKNLKDFFSFLTEEEISYLQEPRNPSELSPNQLGSYLKTLTSLEAVREFCKRKFNFLGAGRYRRTYKINDTFIIKFLINEKEKEQNQNEVKNIECLGEHFAPKIYDFDSQNWWWIIEENVPSVPEEQLYQKLKTILGHQFASWYEVSEFFEFVFNDATRSRMLRRMPERAEPFMHILENNETNEWLMGLKKVIQHCQVYSGDFHTDNWGIRPSTGELLIIDLGF